MKIKFLGQNCFLLTYQEHAILIDPFYNYQKEQSGFDISEQKIDFVLITHAHADHVADVQELLAQYPDATIVGQPEICDYFGHSKNIDFNIGGSVMLGEMKVTMVQAIHTSSFSDGKYGGEPCGYILSCGTQNIYFSGDTGVMSEMELFPKMFGEISLAILPVGGHYTMDAQQASFAASELLKTRKVIGCHFDTFPPIKVNHDIVQNCFRDRGVELVLPKLGMEFDIS